MRRLTDTTVEEAQEYVRNLLACCLATEEFTPLQITGVVYAADDGERLGYSTDRSGFVVVNLADGRVAVVSDNEDYTGHG